MSTKTMMTVDEYLRTSFEDVDFEFVDGELVERNAGEYGHALTQSELIFLLKSLRTNAMPAVRIRTRPTRFRVPDIAVWLAGEKGVRIPTVPPFLIVEVLSPDDRMTRMKIKIEEYLSVGTQWIWLVDPDERKAICYSQSNPAGSVCDTLRTEKPTIEIALEKVLARSEE